MEATDKINWLKVSLVWVFFKIVYEDNDPWGKLRFRFEPRLFITYLIIIGLAPLIIIFIGVIGWWSVLKEKPLKSTSTGYVLTKSERQNKIIAYNKY